VLDAFHVVKLGSAALDEVRRRVQQETLQRRGLTEPAVSDPPHLDDRRRAPHRQARDPARQVPPPRRPSREVHLAWQAHQPLRAIYHASSPETGRRLAEQLIDILHTCPIPELARLGRTLRQWREPILAYFATGGVNNGGTEAINGVIEKTRRRARQNQVAVATPAC
jgi:transposase